MTKWLVIAFITATLHITTSNASTNEFQTREALRNQYARDVCENNRMPLRCASLARIEWNIRNPILVDATPGKYFEPFCNTNIDKQTIEVLTKIGECNRKY